MVWLELSEVYIFSTAESMDSKEQIKGVILCVAFGYT